MLLLFVIASVAVAYEMVFPPSEFLFQNGDVMELESEQNLAKADPNTYPCILRVGTAMYDYTPFRLASQALSNGYVTAANADNSTNWVYGWCQTLSEIPGAPCVGPYFTEYFATIDDPIVCNQ